MFGARVNNNIEEVKTPGIDFETLIKGLSSEEPYEISVAMQIFISFLTYKPLPLDNFYLFAGFNSVVPSYVRRFMAQIATNNTDILEKINIPVLIINGAEDVFVPPKIAQSYLNVMPYAKISIIDKAGHTPHWEGPEIFNHTLKGFLDSL